MDSLDCSGLSRIHLIINILFCKNFYEDFPLTIIMLIAIGILNHFHIKPKARVLGRNHKKSNIVSRAFIVFTTKPCYVYIRG